MTAKEQFVNEFKERENIHPGNLIDKPEVFARDLNKPGNADLRQLFRGAVKEAYDDTAPSAGLDLLFPEA